MFLLIIFLTPFVIGFLAIIKSIKNKSEEAGTHFFGLTIFLFVLFIIAAIIGFNTILNGRGYGGDLVSGGFLYFILVLTGTIVSYTIIPRKNPTKTDLSLMVVMYCIALSPIVVCLIFFPNIFFLP